MLRSLLMGVCFTLALNSVVHANALDKFSELKNAGLLVVDNQGRQLLSDNRNRAFIPASTTKIVTAWLALNRWGEQHRFTTNFYYAPQQAKLWVKGSGDPFLVSEELTTIATQLKQLGVRHVATLALDTSAFTPGLVLPGTSKTNNPYDAVPSALAANFNTVNLKKVGGKIRSAESQTPLTATAKSLARGFKKNKLRVNTGRNPRTAERYFGELFLALLHRQGVTHNNRITFEQTPALNVFYQHRNSKTLGDMIRPMMKYSTNFIANQLALMMTSEHIRRPASALDVQQYMEGTLRASFNWKNITFKEGAGLSRSNRISPVQLVELLESFRQWRHLLPEVETGVFAKSGTLKKVSTLAGYIVDNGQWKPFALMMNQSVPYKLRNRIAKELKRTL